MFEPNEIVINGLLLRYYRVKTSHKNDTPPLIFLHGWRSEGVVWRGVCERLHEHGHAMYALDLPGFGGSEISKTPQSLDDYALVAAEFMRTLNLEGAIVIGHSFGGSVAIKLAAKYPSLVSKLILVDSAGVRKRTLRKRAIALCAQLVKPIFAPRFMQPLRKKLYAMLGAEDYLTTPTLTETFRLVVNEDIAPILSSIAQPALIIWGDRDRATPLKDARVFERAIQNAALVILKGAGHYSFLDKQDEWIECVAKWLS